MAFALLVVVLTGFVDAFSLAWRAGVPFVAAIALSYLVVARRRRRTAAACHPDAAPQPPAGTRYRADRLSR